MAAWGRDIPRREGGEISPIIPFIVNIRGTKQYAMGKTIMRNWNPSSVSELWPIQRCSVGFHGWATLLASKACVFLPKISSKTKSANLQAAGGVENCWDNPTWLALMEFLLLMMGVALKMILFTPSVINQYSCSGLNYTIYQSKKMSNDTVSFLPDNEGHRGPTCSLLTAHQFLIKFLPTGSGRVSFFKVQFYQGPHLV